MRQRMGGGNTPGGVSPHPHGARLALRLVHQGDGLHYPVEVRSEASSPNSLGPERDWPEVRGEECRPRTVLSWLLAKWVVGESEEAGRRTLSSHGPENPEEKEIALSLRRWVLLALGPAAEQKQNETEDSPPGPPPGEGAAAVLAVS